MTQKCFIFLLASFTMLYSCKQHACIVRIIKSVNIDKVNNLKVTDTAAKIIRCVKGSDFIQRVDSSFASIYQKTNGNIYFGAGFLYDFSDLSHDYLIILLPSGTTHRVQNIQYGNEKYTSSPMGGGGTGNDPRISCSFQYTLDGKVVSDGSGFYDLKGSSAQIDL